MAVDQASARAGRRSPRSLGFCRRSPSQPERGIGWERIRAAGVILGGIVLIRRLKTPQVALHSRFRRRAISWRSVSHPQPVEPQRLASTSWAA